jgi:hypothetical protein
VAFFQVDDQVGHRGGGEAVRNQDGDRARGGRVVRRRGVALEQRVLSVRVQGARGASRARPADGRAGRDAAAAATLKS